MTVAEFLAVCAAHGNPAKKVAGGYMVRCPAHDDKTPSLGVTEGTDGRVLLNCHANCTAEAIVDALGLTMRDLMPDTVQDQRRTIVATYDYHNAGGALIHQKVRYEPKDFRQRRPDGNGDWIWNLRGVPDVLYHLPDVIAAVANGDPVWITEGEKDADALIAEGVCATTNPMGAGKWRPSYTETLRGAEVVIVADDDDPGRKHAYAVAAALDGTAVDVAIVLPAHGKDASDHLRHGLTLADFRPLTAADLAPPEPNGDRPTATPDRSMRRFVTAEAFGAVIEPTAVALCGPPGEALIPQDADVMIFGDGGAGKTTAANDIGCHLAAGDDVWGVIPTRGPVRVGIVENEGPRAMFRQKVRDKIAAWPGSPIGDRLMVREGPWLGFTFADDDQREELAADIAADALDVVIVGPIVMAGMEAAGTLQDVRAFLALVDDVRQRSGRPVTFVLVHHENRAGDVSGAWEGATDTLVHITNMGPGRTRVFFQKAKWSRTLHATKITLLWTDGEGFAVAAPEDKVTDADVADMIRDAIAADPGTGWTKVEDATPGVGRQDRNAIRDTLLTDGVIVNIAKIDGTETWLDTCPARKPARLFLATDPTIQHLRRDPGAAPAQAAPTTAGGLREHLRRAPGLKERRRAGADAAPPAGDEPAGEEPFE
jgi:hypothetical protein